MAGGVGEQVLDDPLDLGRVGHDLDGEQLQADRGVEQLLAGLGDHAGDQAGQVDRLAPLDDAPVQLVEVEQAGEDAVQPAGVGDEPADEVVASASVSRSRPR